MILNEREYNRRAKNKADLGVRVQTSNKSDPTAKLAVERVMIREAIEKCDLDGGILKDTDNPEIHRKNIWTGFVNFARFFLESFFIYMAV